MADAIESLTSGPAHQARMAALETISRAAALLFANGQTTERTIAATERIGHALGLSVTLQPRWGELTVHVTDTPFSEVAAATPLGVNMDKVVATMTLIDRTCAGDLPADAVPAALTAVEARPAISALRFVLFAAIGAAALGVIFGALNPLSLLLIAASAAIGAALRRWLASLSGNPFVQPLCAAVVAGLVGGIAGIGATRLNLADGQRLIALCPCMILVPGPHILNGAIDLARARIAIGATRLAYAGLVVLMICAGLLLGLTAGGGSLSVDAVSAAVPLGADMLAAGCAVAAFGTFFAMPWRLLPLPIVVGMVAHAVRWALISLAGAHVAIGALAACLLVGLIMAPLADRLHLPFAGLGFSAVVSLMPGLFLFRAAGSLVALLSTGEHAPVELLQSTVINGTTAFLIVLAMAFGLILPRLLFERVLHRLAQRPAFAQQHRP
ncbi:MAG TPA: threonine/serine exporter family protein [Dongiaceae bacterium]|nr:threonine/serine exporter family protein [Dongiaceae bacterium]